MSDKDNFDSSNKKEIAEASENPKKLGTITFTCGRFQFVPD